MSHAVICRGWGGVFDPRSVHVVSVVDKVALGLVFLQVFPFFPCHIIHAMLHNSLNSTLIRRTSGRSLGTFQKVMPVRRSDSFR
jgi:uncharacterized protein (DUF2062 family)